MTLNLMISTNSNWILVIRCDMSDRAEYKTKRREEGQISSAVKGLVWKTAVIESRETDWRHGNHLISLHLRW